jgi:hypothetical protein
MSTLKSKYRIKRPNETALLGTVMRSHPRNKLIGQFCWPIGCECQRTGACSSSRAEARASKLMWEGHAQTPV